MQGGDPLVSELILPGKNDKGETIEPIRGMRYYNLEVSAPILMGGFGGQWLSNTMTAECDGDAERAYLHLMAGIHQCGLYIRTGPDIEFWKPIRAVSIGWGATDLWEQGARCQYVRITALILNVKPTFYREQKDTLIKALAKRYEVPVTTEEW